VLLENPTVIANFQYCMRPRNEGGPYSFGVLQPDNHSEFAANYNGFWIWRSLRGRMVATADDSADAAAARHCRILASSQDGGARVTAIVYFDTGIATQDRLSNVANVRVSVHLPPGNFALQRSDAAWNVRNVSNVDGAFSGDAKVSAALGPCQAVAFTWTRQ
jgi:hypothetical protein